jgi:hypothetical protein
MYRLVELPFLNIAFEFHKNMKSFIKRLIGVFQNLREYGQIFK